MLLTAALLVVEFHELQILRKAKFSATGFFGVGGRGDAEAVILVDIDAALLRAAPSNCHTTKVQGGSNMTGTDLYVNKPHCAAAVRP